MVKLHYRPPDLRDKTRDDKLHMPFVPGGAPLCADHLAAAENCSCGMPDEVPTINLRGATKRR
jgi:hypothetical protein